jgi:NADH-quinone oxidoreductase subunit E
MPRRVVRSPQAPATKKAPPAGLDLSPVAAVVAEIDPRSSLITVLQRVQQQFGYLPELVVDEIARLSGVPASRIYGIITFYAQFSTTPAGRHKVCVCQGTACHVRGAREVLRAVEKELAIVPGEATPDLGFSLETVACLGACSFSPVMTVDGQYFARMKGSRVSTVLHEFDGGAGVSGEGGHS